jgi:spermidine synthase
MKPRTRLGTARSPGGVEMALYQHDRDFSIEIDGENLMNSRQHESELALARLGCAHLVDSRAPAVLIGGLGMGYTLRQALDMLAPDARVTVGELLAEVVQWNREYLGALNGYPLTDTRVEVLTGDVIRTIRKANNDYDAILLDVDNGPRAMSDPGNRRLYGHQGISACRRALRRRGCLAVWSAEPSTVFERILSNCGLHARRFRIPAYRGSKSRARFVWVASKERAWLPADDRC